MSSLEKRQRSYEDKTKFTPHLPIVIRLDGVGFSKFTRDLEKPFDDIIKYSMENTLLDLCKATQDCIFGYTQSDEITIIIYNRDRYNEHLIYNGRKEKIISILASRTTRLFNKHFYEYSVKHGLCEKLREKLWSAEFDCKGFTMPEWDCINNIIFRQSDMTRNSVNSVARHYYSSKELHGIKTQDVIDKLLNEKGVDFNSEYAGYYTNGSSCVQVLDGERYKFKLIEGSPKFKVSRELFKHYTGLCE